ncbi:MAG: AraC family transcriptional regulator, partial [Acidimicrobiia bacterium]|nr:AraC family transcriptional regulator [Acidimicrobiia bacterium]
TLSSIAAEVGFATPSDFSRVFKASFGQTPSSWDRRSRLDGQPDLGPPDQGVTGHPDLTARVVERPACHVAYVRIKEPWQDDHLAAGYARLISWLSERSIPWRTGQLVGVSWESGKATPLDRLVYDLGITVDPEIPAGDEVAIQHFPAARAVEVHCRSLADTARAWDLLYCSWLPGSGYEPADLPAMKRFRTTPDLFDAAAWDVDCSIALRRRRP